MNEIIITWLSLGSRKPLLHFAHAKFKTHVAFYDEKFILYNLKPNSPDSQLSHYENSVSFPKRERERKRLEIQ